MVWRQSRVTNTAGLRRKVRIGERSWLGGAGEERSRFAIHRPHQIAGPDFFAAASGRLLPAMVVASILLPRPAATCARCASPRLAFTPFFSQRGARREPLRGPSVWLTHAAYGEQTEAEPEP